MVVVFSGVASEIPETEPSDDNDDAPSVLNAEAGRPALRSPRGGLARRIARIKRQTEKYRGLQFLNDVAVGVQTEAEVVRSQTREMIDAFPKGQLTDYSRLMAAIGFWDAGLDIVRLYTRLISAAAAGYYNPRSKHLVIIERPEIGRAHV